MAALRYLTAGESHGEELIGILEGMPAGLSLVAEADIDPWLQERQKGYGRGRRQQIEHDTAVIVSGVRFGITTGAPIAIKIQNRDWANWRERMSITPTELADTKRVTVPRPGHADLAGAIKYDTADDIRNVLERASARETAMRVAIGAIAAKLLKVSGITSLAFVESIGGVRAPELQEGDIFNSAAIISNSPVRTYDAKAEGAMIERIDRAKAEGDTVGGAVCTIVRGMPVGVGSHVHWDRKLDAALASAAMSIQAVKGVEIGDGFRAAVSAGSEVHDEIKFESSGQIVRASNHAGGIEGGMSNGESIVVRAAMKPISTLMRPLNSIDFATDQPTLAHIERSDVCAVPALAIILQAVVSLTLATALLDTFGGDTLHELQTRVTARRVSANEERHSA